MKLSRFTGSKIISILKQAEGGSPVPELCREHGMSSATFYKWRSKFGGMDASLMSRLTLIGITWLDMQLHIGGDPIVYIDAWHPRRR